MKKIFLYFLIVLSVISCDDNKDINKNYNLRVMLSEDLNIVLVWDSLKLTSEIKNYEVYKSDDGKNFLKTAIVNYDRKNNQYKFKDEFAIDAGKTYYYKVRAVTLINTEEFSKIVKFKADKDLDGDGFIADDCAANIKEINPGSEEICDGIDNNCDGKIDDLEDIVTGSDEGECQKGIKRCINGKFETIKEEVKPSSEICDGKDNDCNGLVDDNISDIIIGTDTGECRKGIKRCINHTLVTIQEEIPPREEICDGKDNDCNGLIDDDLYESCRGICGEGERICISGHWLGCSAEAPHAEFWISSAPLRRTYFAKTVNFNGKVFIFGGKINSGDFLNDLWAYSENTNSWEKLVPASNLRPLPRIHASLAFNGVTGEVYLYGGMDGLGNILSDFWKFDLNRKIWEKIIPVNSLGVGLYAASMISDNAGNIIIFGGKSQNEVNGLTFRYSIEQNKWFTVNSEVTPPPLYNQTKLYNDVTNSLYIFGGRKENGDLSNEIWSFNLMSFIWKRESSDELIDGTEFASGYSYNGKFYYFGGNRENGGELKVYEYDLLSKTWFIHDVELNNMMSSLAVRFNGKLMLWGGNNDYGTIFDKDILLDIDMNFNYEFKEELTDIYKPAVAYDYNNEKYYLFGGSAQGLFLNELWSYSPVNNSWEKIETTNRPSPREGAALLYDEGENSLYLYGGRGYGNNYGDLWKLSLDNPESWEYLDLTEGPSYRIDGYLFYGDGNIYLFGGYEQGDKLDLYKLNKNDLKWEKIDFDERYPLPVQREGYAVIYSPKNDYLFLFGGYNEDEVFNDLWLFDIKQNKWLTYYIGIVKPERRKNAIFVYDYKFDSVYLTGGIAQDGRYLNDLWLLEIGAGNWSLIKNNTDNTEFNGRSGYVSFFVGGREKNYIYLMGGKNENFYYSSDKLNLTCGE